ncbi:MAG TPA: peptidoglycan-associated lipoprotein Pal [Myxococcales bacterium]|nr:peptidoglycan-associated lipoprotein Pal [Myxococcales bacterium]HET9754632.1 peptidoglycan-associated lipoprotein Pal [Myxococcales bacterium]
MKLSDIAGHAVTLGLAGLVACSAHNAAAPDATAQEQKPQAPVAQAQTPSAEDQYHAQGQADLDKALEDLRNVSVFFEFDSAALTKDAQQKLGTVADILVKHPELKVRIEGNADERGSEQYNLALGQRRADAAKKYLDNLGVKKQQITAISFGAERPKATGHDEEAWRQNRRDDVNAQQPK